MPYELHEPTFDGTSSDRWEEPDWKELAGDNPKAIAGHFLLCKGGFPPESVSDLELAVVDETGRLNRNALADAVVGPNSVKVLDVSDEFEAEVEDRVQEYLRDHFESMPETKAEVNELILYWRQKEEDYEHDIDQKMRTDDEARYHEVKGQIADTGEDRPEKGR